MNETITVYNLRLLLELAGFSLRKTQRLIVEAITTGDLCQIRPNSATLKAGNITVKEFFVAVLKENHKSLDRVNYEGVSSELLSIIKTFYDE